MVDIKKFLEVDLYGLIGVDITATEIEIRKSYRKKALECHPDKNPDNPKAAELFQQLSKALEILLDESARSAYNKVLNARKAAELRNKQLDSKRQKLKADLEAREKQAFSSVSKKSGYSCETRTPEEILKNEIERLRKEGSKLLEEEQSLLQQQLSEERLKFVNHYDSTKYRIKIKWNSPKTDETNGGYSEDILRKYLKKYGDINAFVMSKKNGSALVEFSSKDAAEMAVSYEKGNLKNPITLSWVNHDNILNTNHIGGTSSYQSTTIKETDYESLVLRQMRQAEERKKLIEQMMNED